MSFFHTCSLVMAIRGEVRASSLPELLRSLSPVFVPRDLSYRLADEDMEDLLYEVPATLGQPQLWRGESVDEGELLTRYRPSDEREFYASFEQRVKDRSDTTFWMSMTGALRHRLPGASTAEWFGRWRSGKTSLHELLTVRITCKPSEPREFEITFPLAGYPLSAARLGHDKILAGDPQTAHLNREELLPVVAAARAALDLAPDEARWWLDGDFYADYPEDNRALEEWLTRMNAA